VLFDGLDARAAVADVFDFAGGLPFTLEAWIKPRAPDSKGAVMAKIESDDAGSTGSRSGYLLQVDANISFHVAFAFYDASAKLVFVESSVAPPPGSFTHCGEVSYAVGAEPTAPEVHNPDIFGRSRA
jgi:hypothetical protein